MRWTDPAITPTALGVTGVEEGPTLSAVLDANRSVDGPPLRPAHVRAAELEWRPEPPLEFYVDFETVSDLADDFSTIPERGGQSLIFMIGCGHLEDGDWQWRCFITDDLGIASEGRIIDDWFAHMAAVRARRAPDEEPRVYHWSHAERSWLESAYNSARKRHPLKHWPQPRWFDFLSRVVRPEPVVMRGAFGFGLKAIAKAMHDHGLIETRWQDGPSDGMGAMVGAWWCAGQAREHGCRLSEVAFMDEIESYNEVDCRVMMEIVRHLRREH